MGILLIGLIECGSKSNKPSIDDVVADYLNKLMSEYVSQNDVN